MVNVLRSFGGYNQGGPITSWSPGVSGLLQSERFTAGLTAYPGEVTPTTPNAAPTVAPTWQVDFTRDTALPQQLSLSRTSSATYFNSSGLIASASSSSVRIEYDPAINVPLGVLLEDQATNAVLNSANYSSNTLIGVTRTANATTAPDGTLTASFFTEAADSNQRTIYQGISQTGFYVFSTFAKASTRHWIGLRAGPSNAYVANFDLTAGTIGTVAASTTAFMQNAGNGWYRCAIIPGASNTNINSIVSMGDADTGTGLSYTYTGNGTSGLYLWGFQHEAAAAAVINPTSFIFTTSAAVTRSGDILSSTNADLLAATGWIAEVGQLRPATASTILGVNTVVGIGTTTGNALTTADGGTQTTTDTGTWTGTNRAGLAWTP